MLKGVAIGIDLGTSGLRAALVDASDACVAMASAPITAARRRDPQAWRAALEHAVSQLGDLSAVRAVAVDGTSGTVVPVDAQGVPLAPASLYNDPANPDAVAEVARIADADSAARGGTSPLAKLLGLRARPGIARLLHEADWLTGTMCGRFGVTDENNALKTGYDPRARAWPDWVRAVGGDLLPEVVPAGAVLGPLTDRTLGLPPQTLVVAGTTDGCAAFLATGADEVGDAVTSLGSTLVIKLLSDVAVFAPQHGIYSHLLRGRWLAGGASNTGGAALLQHFDLAAIERLSAAIDPAAESGLDYYPLPAPGERFPVADPAQTSRHAPRPRDDAHFLHGLLQGVARVEALGYRRLAQLGRADAAQPAHGGRRRAQRGVDVNPRAGNAHRVAAGPLGRGGGRHRWAGAGRAVAYLPPAKACRPLSSERWKTNAISTVGNDSSSPAAAM